MHFKNQISIFLEVSVSWDNSDLNREDSWGILLAVRRLFENVSTRFVICRYDVSTSTACRIASPDVTILVPKFNSAHITKLSRTVCVTHSMPSMFKPFVSWASPSNEENRLVLTGIKYQRWRKFSSVRILYFETLPRLVAINATRSVHSHYFNSITTITNPELVVNLSTTAFIANLAEYCTWFGGSRVQLPSGVPTFFATGVGWVVKYMILTLENFRHRI